MASETRFLARLRHDLLRLGVSARILANLHLGTDDRQIDFVVITADHVLQVELKVFPGPIVSSPKTDADDQHRPPDAPSGEQLARRFGTWKLACRAVSVTSALTPPAKTDREARPRGSHQPVLTTSGSAGRCVVYFDQA